MVWVNFLPWRQRRRSAQRLRARLLPGLLALLPVAIFFQASGQRADNEQSQNILASWQKANQQLSSLKVRATTLSAQKRRLLQQVATRERQQQVWHDWFVFARDLTEQMPETLWLSEINQDATGFSLTGFSTRIREVQDFRQRLQSLAFFRLVKMDKVSLDEQGMIRFRLLGVLPTEGRE